MPKTGILDQVVVTSPVKVVAKEKVGIVLKPIFQFRDKSPKGRCLESFLSSREDLFALDMPHLLVIDFPKRSILTNM